MMTLMTPLELNIDLVFYAMRRPVTMETPSMRLGMLDSVRDGFLCKVFTQLDGMNLLAERTDMLSVLK